MAVDPQKVAEQIVRLRKRKNLTQAELGERLNVSYQAVSKWETGKTLPDTGLLPDLAQVLETTVDNILMGGERAMEYKGNMQARDMIEGINCLMRMGELLGRQNLIYRCAVEGISERINSDVEEMLESDFLRECLAAEAIIHNMRMGYHFDLTEIKRQFRHEHWVQVLGAYAQRYGIK